MKLFDVYPLYDINIVKGQGCKVWDENGTEYLDLYGGHAVISIGHAHPHYVSSSFDPDARLLFEKATADMAAASSGEIAITPSTILVNDK